MENLITQALKNDLQERYDVVAVWEDEWARRNFRIVFELLKGNGVQLDRAIRYVNVTVLDGCITLDSQNRKSIKVDYFCPSSMDKIDEFIAKNCVGGKKEVVVIRAGWKDIKAL